MRLHVIIGHKKLQEPPMTHRINFQNFCPLLSKQLHQYFSSKTSPCQKKEEELKTASAGSRYFNALKEGGTAFKNKACHTFAVAAAGAKKTLAVTHKILTINGIITPTRIAQSLLATTRAVWAIVWPLFDLGLSFIPGYSQTKALIQAIPSLFILAATTFVGYQSWRLIAYTGLDDQIVNIASNIYHSPIGEAATQTASTVASTALSVLKEGGKYVFQAGAEYLPRAISWLYS